MKPDEIVELSRFEPTRDQFGSALPFAIYFVYTPDKFIMVKGMSDAVREFVEKTYPKCIYRYSFWQNGESRGHWRSTMEIYFSPKEINGRLWTVVSMVTKNGYKKEAVKFRRVPKRWLPIYDQALKK